MSWDSGYPAHFQEKDGLAPPVFPESVPAGSYDPRR